MSVSINLLGDDQHELDRLMNGLRSHRRRNRSPAIFFQAAHH
ncbi:hypothetical protein [Nonomuraea zeae]|nr:hypothetical protein [Nonomuraea zeae]